MYILHKANTLNVYRATVTGLRISAVDGGATASGGAFVDGLDAGILALPLDGTHSMEIYDSTGRMIRGVLKAVGTGETLDSALVTGDDSDMDTVGNWLAENAASEVTSQTGGNPGNDLRLKNISAEDAVIAGILTFGSTLTQKALYKYTMDVLASDGYAVKVRNSVAGNVQQFYSKVFGTGSWATYSDYSTIVNADSTVLYGGVYLGVGSTRLIDNVLLRKVLTPSTSGATIVSAKGGVTYNFGYKDASFTYNAASYYCIVKKLR